MRVLVTGAAGMIGAHVTDYYAQRGDEVVALDNLMRSQLLGYKNKSVEYNWDYLAKYNNVERVIGDVRKERDILKAIKDGVDVVIHTAGQPGVSLSVRIPKEDFSINAFGTLNVLECLRKKSSKATFVYCGTNKVYGENVNKISLKEEERRYVFKETKGVSELLCPDLTGHTPYGISKYIGDLYTQEYAYMYGMKTGVFRMSSIFGTLQYGFEGQGWVAWFVIATLLDKPITIYGDGKQVRDLLYVDDLVDAFSLFIKSNLKHAVFNIGGGAKNAFSLLELLDLLETETGKKSKIAFSDWRPSDQKVYISDITKIKKELNWKPKTNIKEGVTKIIEWVTENKRIQC